MWNVLPWMMSSSNSRNQYIKIAEPSNSLPIWRWINDVGYYLRKYSTWLSQKTNLRIRLKSSNHFKFNNKILPSTKFSVLLIHLLLWTLGPTSTWFGGHSWGQLEHRKQHCATNEPPYQAEWYGPGGADQRGPLNQQQFKQQPSIEQQQQQFEQQQHQQQTTWWNADWTPCTG